MVALICGLISVSALGPALARADLATEVSQGQQLADALTSGHDQCSSLSPTDFELVGEYAMDQFIGDGAAHQTMNDRMARTMGSPGEIAMHEALGHRYTGCPGGPSGGWAMPMAGMMSRYGEGQGYGSGPGMMGDTGYGPMMGGDGYQGQSRWGQPEGDEETSAWTIVAVAVGGVILGGLLVLLGMRLRRPGSAA